MEKVAKKLEKLAAMDTSETRAGTVALDEKCIVTPKRSNALKVSYKKNIKYLSDKKGPRAYGK